MLFDKNAKIVKNSKRERKRESERDGVPLRLREEKSFSFERKRGKEMKS